MDIHTHRIMEEAPSGSSVDGEPEGGAVNVENEMDEIQHYHNTIYIYIYVLTTV